MEKSKVKKPLITELQKEARLSMKNPIGFCGHHCGFCTHKACGGCRSEYIGTSYKVACGGICPNNDCARKKKLNGCYECNNLEKCKKGYYSKENEYVAKATALFVKKYGEKCYTETLKKAVEAGIKYPKNFDKTGSIEGALELLEKYKEG